MKWFKHDSDANRDEKLQNVLLDYGLEGYGLYWYCLELITYDVDQHNLTFDLRHDARIIARNVGSTEKRIEEMMKYFIEIGLFECSQGHITCLKLLKRLDQSMTSKSAYRAAINTAKEQFKLEKLINPIPKGHDRVMTGSGKGHELEVEEELEEEIDKEKKNIKRKEVNQDGDFQISEAAYRCLAFYNDKAGCKCRDAKPFIELLTETKTRKAYTEDEITLVIEWALTQWPRRGGTPKPVNICRVTRFDGYLADAEKWRELSVALNATDVVEAYNSEFDGILPTAELDRDIERKILTLSSYMRDKSINGFIAYFQKFKGCAPGFYFGENDSGWLADIDFLLKPETLRKTRNFS